VNETEYSRDEDATVEELLAVVREIIAELHPHQRSSRTPSLDASLDRELGFDSLSRVELLSRIERRFDVALPERLFAEAETPRDLLRAVLLAKPLVGTKFQDVARLALGGTESAPISAETLIHALDWHIDRHPERPHIRLYRDDGEGQTLSYLELKSGALQVAAGLQYHGVEPGQAVAIMLPTGPEYFFSFLGTLLAGGVPVPIYPPARMSQLEEHLRRHGAILANCGAPILITVPEGRRVGRLLRGRVENLRYVASVAELSSLPGGWAEPRIVARDLAFLQYTSGSTGTPKGVALTHANLLANIRAMGEAVNASSEDVFVSWLPLYHDMGLIGAWLGSLYHAMPLVLMSPLSFLSRPQRWLWAIHRYRGTLSASPNFGYEMCRRRLENRDLEGLDLSSWRLAFNGAEAVSPETVEGFIERFRPYGFHAEAMQPVYGLAESSVGLAFPPPGRGPLIDRIRREPFSRRGIATPADDSDRIALRFVSCGLPLPGHQIRVVDEVDRELPERQQGYIHFRGPSATSGYFRDREHTRALFHGDWLDSGDLGYIAGGELYLTGRVKDIIIRGGRNIYPHEIEQVVSAVDGVRKGCVAVFGGKNQEVGTERLIVLAETRLREAGELDEVRARINASVTDLLGAPPDDIVLAAPGAVLKTSSGKVRRAAIRELYERGDVGKPQRAVWGQIARLAMTGWLPRWRRLLARTAEWSFAAYAWSVFGLLAPVVWTAVMILPSDMWRWRIMRGGIRLLRWATRTRLRVRGLEDLPPPDQPFVLVSNHASYLDAYALIAAIPRPISFVAKAELGLDPLLGRALTQIGTEFVERFEAEKGVGDARRLAGALSRGRSLVFFAEGTFTRVPGLMPFRLGAFAAALEAGVPVVPVALRGTRSMLRGDSWFPRRGAIGVTLGKPLNASAALAESGDIWRAALRMRDEARAQILRYCGEPDLGFERSEIPVRD